MAIELSSNNLVYVDSGSPAVPAVLGNQQNSGLSMSANRIDAANKTSSGWAPAIAGLREFQITVDGQADPTNVPLADLVENAIGGANFTAEDVLYSTGNGYSAEVQATQLEINGANQQFTQYRSTMVLATGSPSAITSP